MGAGDARGAQPTTIARYVYNLEALQKAATHDEVWNAAQTELVRTGRMHNYLRMLWGKKILGVVTNAARCARRHGRAEQ